MTSIDRVLLLGPPGTGKTTALLEEITEAAKTTPLDRIGFVSFTRAAVAEARSRLPAGTTAKDTPWMRTIHSFAKRCGGVHGRLLGAPDLETFGLGAKLVCPYELARDRDAAVRDMTDALAVINHRRLTGLGFDEIVQGHLDYASPYRYPEDLDKIARSYAAYKRNAGVVDFTDLLVRFRQHANVPQLDVLLVDEAQDLSALQWAVIDETIKASGARRVVVAGDDDQTIFSWAGADVRHLHRFAENADVRVLKQSYRVPRLIQARAQSLLDMLRGPRLPKDWLPRDADGVCEHVVSGLPVQTIRSTPGKWFVLARSNWSAWRQAKELKAWGEWFTVEGKPPMHSALFDAACAWKRWRETGSAEDRQKIGPYLENAGEKSRVCVALHPPDPTAGRIEDLVYLDVVKHEWWRDSRSRIDVRTIHSTKGLEANHVYLDTVIASKLKERFDLCLDDELRTFYVGATRARETLLIGHPHGRCTFPYLG